MDKAKDRGQLARGLLEFLVLRKQQAVRSVHGSSNKSALDPAVVHAIRGTQHAAIVPLDSACLTVLSVIMSRRCSTPIPSTMRRGEARGIPKANSNT